MQQGAMDAHTVLSCRHVPTDVFFMQQPGGAIPVSVGQTVYTSALVRGLVGLVQGQDAATMVNIVPAQALGKVLQVYNLFAKCSS